MATIPFSQLPNLDTLTANTIIPVVSANVNYTVTTANLQSYVSNNPSGNISVNNLTATGNVTASVLSATGNITGGNLNISGNIVDPSSSLQIRSGGNLELVPTTQINLLGPVSATGNITSGNISTNGTVSATGNITGNNIFTSGLISATGNITGNFIFGNIRNTTGGAFNTIFNGNSNVLISSANSNVAVSVANIANVVVFSTSGISVSGTISSTGNIIGPVLAGNIIQSPTTSIAALQNLTQYTERCEDLGTSSTSITPDYNNGIIQLFRVTNNFTLNPPLNMVPGRSLTLVLTQDNVGNRVMTANVIYKFAYGIKTLSTAANDTDVLSIFMTQNANATFLCNLVRDYS
jgi:hypothetical protein